MTDRMTRQQPRGLNTGRAILVAISLIGFVSCGFSVPIASAEEVVLKPPKLVLTPPASESAAPAAKKSEFLLKPTAPAAPKITSPAAPQEPSKSAIGSPAAPVVETPAAPTVRKKSPAVMVGSVSFNEQSSNLPGSTAAVLLPVVSRMKAQPAARLSLRGYSQTMPKDKKPSTIEPTASDYYRQSLSQAMAVRDWLVAAGIAKDRIDLEPKGQGVIRANQQPLNRVELMIQGR